METPAPGCQFFGIVKATKELWFLRDGEAVLQYCPVVYLPREVIFATTLEISLPVIFLSNLQRLRRQVERAMSGGILSQNLLSLSGGRHYVPRERESGRRSRIAISELRPLTSLYLNRLVDRIGPLL